MFDQYTFSITLTKIIVFVFFLFDFSLSVVLFYQGICAFQYVHIICGKTTDKESVYQIHIGVHSFGWKSNGRKLTLANDHANHRN